MEEARRGGGTVGRRGEGGETRSGSGEDWRVEITTEDDPTTEMRWWQTHGEADPREGKQNVFF